MAAQMPGFELVGQGTRAFQYNDLGPMTNKLEAKPGGVFVNGKEKGRYGQCR